MTISNKGRWLDRLIFVLTLNDTPRESFRWWLIFEQARRCELRRGRTFTAMMVMPELVRFAGAARGYADRIERHNHSHRIRSGR